MCIRDRQGAVIDNEFLNFIDEKVDEFPPLGNDAAKELLIYNPFDDTANGTMHNNFYTELDNLNGTGYPTTIPTIGVAFSNGLPNPGKDLIWETITEGLGTTTLKKADFTVSNEWANGGSFLPLSATNLSLIHISEPTRPY